MHRYVVVGSSGSADMTNACQSARLTKSLSQRVLIRKLVSTGIMCANGLEKASPDNCFAISILQTL